jgi:hypothetical protein
MMLTPQAVSTIFLDCLFRDEELTGDKPPPDAVLVEGIVTSAGFHPGRLKQHEAEIVALLGELPPEFKDGWSFLNMCTDKHGNLWTGVHRSVEELVLLGMGIGKVKLCAPREMWAVLPGGVPYYQVS